MIKWKKEKGTDLSVVGLIVTLGIVYGDLGTSPLYTMQAIMRTLDFIYTPYFDILHAVF